MKVRVAVESDASPAVGVPASQGREVVVTDAAGEAGLEARAGELISICPPSDTRVIGARWRPAAGRVRFRLTAEPQPRAFSAVYFTDVHLLPNVAAAEQPFTEALAEMAALTPTPAFYINGGDIELQTGMGQLFLRMLARLPAPVYHVIGNHELLVGQPDPKAEFRRLFGPTRHAWNYGGAHFVVLDATTAHPEEDGWRNVHGAIDDEELAWLEADLAAAPAGAPVIGFVHIPPFSTFGDRRGKPFGSEPAWDVAGRERLAALLGRRNTQMVLAGHFHENERLWAEGVQFISTGAVCGQWWESGGRPPVNVDGSPKGYRLIHVDGDSAWTAYKSVGQPLRYQLRIVGPRAGEEVRGPIGIGVNVFDGDIGWRVDYRLGRGEWRPLRFTPQLARRNVLSNTHFWAGYAEADGVRPGAQTLQVRAAAPDGAAYTEQVAFVWRPESG